MTTISASKFIVVVSSPRGSVVDTLPFDYCLKCYPFCFIEEKLCKCILVPLAYLIYDILFTMGK